MIPVECAACGATLQIPDSAAGKMVRCRRCDTVLPVPVIEELAGDVVDDPVDDLAEDVVDDIADGLAEDIANDIADGTADDIVGDLAEQPDWYELDGASLPPARRTSRPSRRSGGSGKSSRRKTAGSSARGGNSATTAAVSSGPSPWALRLQGALIGLAGVAVIGLAFGLGYLMNSDNRQDPPNGAVADLDDGETRATVPGGPQAGVPSVSQDLSPAPQTGNPAAAAEQAARQPSTGPPAVTMSPTGRSQGPPRSGSPEVKAPSTATPAGLAGESTRPPTERGDGMPPAVFRPLSLEEPATAMALTEDRRFLVITHQSAHRVSVYDLDKDVVTATLSTESPRSVLCRGDQVFVANDGEGTISVFSISAGWKQTRELLVGRKHIVHLSAAQAEYFSGELLVTCHDAGKRDGGSTIFRVDVARDQHQVIGSQPLACVSYDGRLVKTQSSFRSFPSGNMTFYPQQTFVAGTSHPLYEFGIRQTPFTYQLYPGSIWFGDNQVFAGNPMHVIRDELGVALLGDVSQKLAYSLSPDLITAHRVDASMTKMNWMPRRVVLPASAGKLEQINSRDRRASYLLDHNVAVTRNQTLHLFLQNPSNGAILHARMPAFQAVPVLRSGDRDSGTVPAGGTPLAGNAPTSAAGPATTPSTPLDANSDAESPSSEAPANRVGQKGPIVRIGEVPRPDRQQTAAGFDPATHAVFEPLQLEEPATCMALTEDRRFLVITHQTAHMVSVYDLQADAVTATLPTESPRSVLCRGDQVFVANYGEGTISVFSISEGWKQTDELAVGQPHIVHLAAAQGEYYDGGLMVSCRVVGERNRAGKTYYIDVDQDRSTELGVNDPVSVSYDGRLANVQGSSMTFFSLQSFVQGQAERVYQGGPPNPVYTYQLYPGSLWLGDNQVFGGNPMRLLKKDLGGFLLGDVSQKLAYAVDRDLVKPHRVDASMSAMNWPPRRVALPQSASQFSRIAQRGYRRRDTLLDNNIAVTRGNVLHLFIENLTNGGILQARTQAYRPVPVPRSGGAGEPTSSELANNDSDAVDAPTDGRPASHSANGLFASWPQSTVAGQPFAWEMPPGDDVQIQLVNGPSSFQQESGQLIWRPTPADVGTHELKLRVVKDGVTKFERLTLDVIAREIADRREGGVSGFRPIPRPDRQPKAAGYDLSTHAVFEPLLLDEPATSMALTEDRRFLVMTHQAAHMVSVYDLQADTVTAVIRTESPRSVLCRGDEIFVANYGEGTISVFSMAAGWKQTNEVAVDSKHIVHLSAAQGEYFAGKLLATCRDPNSRSYAGTIYYVDVARDRHQKTAGHALACVSYDGRLAKTQGSFNSSPGGGMGFFPLDTFVEGKPERLNAGGISQTPYTYQLYPGSLWFGDNQVFGGNPLRMVREDLGDILMGDVSQKLAYALEREVLKPYRVDAAMTEIRWPSRRVVLPTSAPQYSKMTQRVYRRREYLLDHNIAVTRDNVLHLFLQDLTNGAILHARTAAYQSVPAPRSNVSLRTSLEENAVQRPDDILPKEMTAEPPVPQPAGRAASDLPANELFAAWPPLMVAGEKLAWDIPIEDGLKIEVADARSPLQLEAGQLVWRPTVADVGTHEFKLRVDRNGFTRFERLTLEVISRELADHVKGDLSHLNEFPRLPLQNDTVQVVRGRGDLGALILQGDQLVVAGPTLKDTKIRQLPRRYTRLDQRAGELIAVAQNPPVLDVLDARTLQVKRTVDLSDPPMEIQEITDLAAHPGQHTSCLCVKSGVELPRFRVLQIDEDSGEVAATAIIGNWARYAGEGRFLITGYSDIFRSGTNFHVNPDWRLIATPKYGGIDMLLTWDVSGRRPRLLEVVEEAGGNGKGIRVSAAEDRVVYLSHVGSPRHSRDLIGFPARKLAVPKVKYATSGVAGTQQGAFHPLLPLYVAIDQDSVAVFHADTGARESNRLLATANGVAGDRITNVLFTLGGQSMLLVRSNAETGPYLQEIGLRTAASEFAAARQREPVLLSAPQFMKVPRRELTSLQSPPLPFPRTPEEIGKLFMTSVVIVETPEGTGTGFVVGANGYLVTCAHVVENDAQVTVLFPDPRNPQKIVRRAATVCNADYDLDVALLKIDYSMSNVFLARDSDIATGAAVTVIGHPGAGADILEYTMTTGIVSSASRNVDGVDTIQISAAVNPGNSGGPVFDANGNVAGMVASKAHIEGASFAINIQVVREFLLRVSK